MSVLRIILVCAGGLALSLHAQSTVPTVSRAIPPQALVPGGATTTLDLNAFFGLPGVSGPVVQFDTVFGKFNVELRPDAAPQHVVNFLAYVQRGDYSNSLVHRSSSFDGGAVSIVQGGAFKSTVPLQTIATSAPVPLEYNLPNERGMLAAARTSDINSATSQWYVNVRDNTSILGQSNGGGYTVFGRVLGSGMTVVDAMAALPRVTINGNAALAELPVRNYTAGNSVQVSNFVTVNSVSPIAVFPSGSAPAVLSFTAQSSASNIVNAAIVGSVLVLTPIANGTANITVRATDTNGNVAENTFAATVTTAKPSFTTQPVTQTVATGSTVVFTANASGASNYRWQLNGTDVAGASGPTLVINNATSANAGSYTAIATNANGDTTSSAATLNIVSAAPADIGRLVNLSIRSNAGAGDQTLIVGFALSGGSGGSLPLLLRGVGPTLANFGVGGTLADPIATLYTGDTALAVNDDWNGDAQVSSRATAVGAFALSSNLDAALAQSRAAGGYTAQITGKSGGTGVALAEIYDAAGASFSAATPRLVNVSARTQVGTGDNILISGFVIRGSTSKTLLVRGVGPALANFGVSGTLNDPRLQILNESRAVLFENNDWGGDPQIVTAATSVGGFPITNGGSKDAALLVTLPPGNYYAQVSGADGGTGVALVEVYEVQ